jgi:hypothetical protein
MTHLHLIHYIEGILVPSICKRNLHQGSGKAIAISRSSIESVVEIYRGIFDSSMASKNCEASDSDAVWILD